MQRKYKINPDLHEIQRALSENLALPVVHSGHLGSPGVQADVDRLLEIEAQVRQFLKRNAEAIPGAE